MFGGCDECRQRGVRIAIADAEHISHLRGRLARRAGGRHRERDAHTEGRKDEVGVGVGGPGSECRLQPSAEPIDDRSRGRRVRCRGCAASSDPATVAAHSNEPARAALVRRRDVGGHGRSDARGPDSVPDRVVIHRRIRRPARSAAR